MEAIITTMAQAFGRLLSDVISQGARGDTAGAMKRAKRFAATTDAELKSDRAAAERKLKDRFR